jgi:hypothetical protein
MLTTQAHTNLGIFAVVLHWWHNRHLETRPHADPDAYDRPPGLMVRRMARLGLDSQDLRRAEPLQFQKLQANCLSCPCPELCALALMDETIDCGWQEWRNYCPNATELSLLSAVNACRADVDGTKAEPTR